VKRMGDVMDIVALKRQGLSERQIAKRLGMSRKTVHKYLEDPEISERERRVVVRESKLDPYMIWGTSRSGLMKILDTRRPGFMNILNRLDIPAAMTW